MSITGPHLLVMWTALGAGVLGIRRAVHLTSALVRKRAGTLRRLNVGAGLRPMLRHADDDEGMILVMTAMMLPAIMIFIGLMLDGSLMYADRRELQDAADAAGLAGAMQVDLQHFADTGRWRISDGSNIPGALTSHEAAQQICAAYGVTCISTVLPEFGFRTFEVRAETTHRLLLIHLFTGTPTVDLRAESISVMVPGF